MSIFQGIQYHFQVFGVSGLVLAAKSRLTNATVEAVFHPKEISHPLHLRVRSSDGTLFQQIFANHQYDLRPARRPVSIVDAGANIGLASVFYANKYPDAKIISIEPQTDNFRMLKLNTSPYPNITPVQAAIWNTNGEIYLRDPGWGNASFRAGDSNGTGHMVRALTIERLMLDHQLDYIDLLKMDIEGAEKEVFEGSEGWIERVGMIVIELHDR